MTQLRAARAADAAALARLHAEGFSTPWSADEFSALLGGPGAFGLAIEAEGAVQGFILCRILIDEAEVLTLAVASERRRAGLGAGLMRAALTLAGAHGAASMVLEVAADNGAAIRLYERLGFSRIGLRRGYYHRQGHPPVDALVYRKTQDGSESD